MAGALITCATFLTTPFALPLGLTNYTSDNFPNEVNNGKEVASNYSPEPEIHLDLRGKSCLYQKSHLASGLTNLLLETTRVPGQQRQKY